MLRSRLTRLGLPLLLPAAVAVTLSLPVLAQSEPQPTPPVIEVRPDVIIDNAERTPDDDFSNIRNPGPERQEPNDIRQIQTLGQPPSPWESRGGYGDLSGDQEMFPDAMMMPGLMQPAYAPMGGPGRGMEPRHMMMPPGMYPGMGPQGMMMPPPGMYPGMMPPPGMHPGMMMHGMHPGMMPYGMDPQMMMGMPPHHGGHGMGWGSEDRDSMGRGGKHRHGRRDRDWRGSEDDGDDRGYRDWDRGYRRFMGEMGAGRDRDDDRGYRDWDRGYRRFRQGDDGERAGRPPEGEKARRREARAFVRDRSAGIDAFRAAAMKMAMLEREDIDWTKVDFDRANEERRLIERILDEVQATRSDVANGVSLSLSAEPEVLAKLDTLMPQVLAGLKERNTNWTGSVRTEGESRILEVTSSDAADQPKLRAMGFSGLFVAGLSLRDHLTATLMGDPSLNVPEVPVPGQPGFTQPAPQAAAPADAAAADAAASGATTGFVPPPPPPPPAAPQ